MDFPLFQFNVDNATSVERAVALLMEQYALQPQPLRQQQRQPDWVSRYLHQTPNIVLHHHFFSSFISEREEVDLLELRHLLRVSGFVPDRWLLKTACDRGDLRQAEGILRILLEVPDVEVDAWICAYVANVPTLLNLFLEKLDTQ
jgi:hypothetical protein